MKQKKYFFAPVFILLFTVIIHSQNTSIGFITGPPAGTYAKFGHNIAMACQPMDINVLGSAGSVDNVTKLMTPKSNIDFGITQLDVLEGIKTSKGASSKIGDIKMIMPLYLEEIHLIVHKNRGISKLKDLNNKKVNIGPKTSGTFMSANRIRELTKIKWNESNMKIIEAFPKLMQGALDAIFYVAGKPFPILSKFPKDISEEIELISIKDKALDSIYNSAEIPENTYPWQPNKIQTYSVQSILASGVSASNSKVTLLTQCIIKKLSELKTKRHKKWGEVNPKNYKKIKWQIHSEAEKIIGK